MRLLPLTLVALLIAVSCRAADAPPPPRVVCFGDSITKAGYPKALAEILKVDVVNAGVGGNTTAMALKRLRKDAIDPRPAVVVVFFGTNDCRLAEPEVAVPVEQYEKNLVAIAAACEKAGARVVFCTMPPINPVPYFARHKREPFDKAGGLEAVCEAYRAAARRAADARHAPLVDLGALLAKTPEWMAPDGVHPTAAGTTMIAKHVADAVGPIVAGMAGK